jgi:hypothetical protein
VRKRWWGSSGRQVPELAVEGDPELPLDEALVLPDVSDLAALRDAHEQGRPVVVLADSAEAVLGALARPEVAAVVVPEEQRALLDLDLTKLTYG